MFLMLNMTTNSLPVHSEQIFSNSTNFYLIQKVKFKMQ